LTPFISQFVLYLTSHNSTSQNIGGRMHGPSPPPQVFWGTVPQSPPKSPPMPHRTLQVINLSTYIAPLQVTTQRRSQPRLGQREESWGVYKRNWKGPERERRS